MDWKVVKKGRRRKERKGRRRGSGEGGEEEKGNGEGRSGRTDFFKHFDLCAHALDLVVVLAFEFFEDSIAVLASDVQFSSLAGCYIS